MLAVAEASPQTPGISAPSVGILVTVGARTAPHELGPPATPEHPKDPWFLPASDSEGRSNTGEHECTEDTAIRKQTWR